MKTVKIWDNLFDYWAEDQQDNQACKGASEEDVRYLENILELELPIEFKQSLYRCNSYPSEYKSDKSSCLFLGGSGILYSVSNIIEYINDSGWFVDVVYEYTDKRLSKSPIEWSRYFIRIYSWNCDIYALIDLRPESNNYGQILYEDPEFGTLGIWANSYVEFLQSLADAILDHGAFNHDDMKKIRDRINNETRSK